MPVQSGDRFRLTRDSPQHLTIIGLAPSHTMSVAAVVPAGTVVVALDQVPGAIAFYCYPEQYEDVETELVPESTRAGNYSAYSLWFPESEIGGLLEPLEPLSPRPPNRLPRGGH
jgi:hypothetical protein